MKDKNDALKKIDGSGSHGGIVAARLLAGGSLKVGSLDAIVVNGTP